MLQTILSLCVPDQVGNGSLGEAKGLELNNLVTLQSLQTLHCQLGGVRQPDMAQPGRVALEEDLDREAY